jgi:hypothetical protein
MDDQELRQMVRESIARHLGAERRESDTLPVIPVVHASFARLPLTTGADDGSCVIEPAVRCTHCGYCQSYGH